ncbi:exodeoxyribonuclease V subunit beta [uncultured Aquitalea sp.]|uniref:exodeoxyribonuclease V subunit beta n=1 Tax=uncultured Aquitalea sp. TaxID=540272 RepID=UPI0025FFD85A|nr:exodeoxyribonuclease V subunit beta [uncultured Aquitalea sp.]
MSLRALDALHCPLSGVNLIEASAGTGKTWTIEALYVRLLLEERDGPPPGVDQLLVVTYTKAATAELRDRLRARLASLLAVMRGADSADDFLLAMAGRFPPGPARELAIQRLLAAVTGFDAAAIYTIHGFCQRVLTDAAFESGQTFTAELVSDDDRLLVEVADDFWRRRVLDDAFLAQVLAESGDTPEVWLAEVKPWLSKPYLDLRRPPPGELTRARAEAEQAWRALAADADALTAGLELLLAAEGFKATSHSPAQLARAADALSALCQPGGGLPPLGPDVVKLLGKLTPDGLARGMKKGFAAPAHALFERVASFLAAWDDYRAALALSVAGMKLELIDWINSEMMRRRAEERVRGFDDLLTDLGAALKHPELGPSLAAAVSRQFHAALIDEFQDTDPIQYEIFRDCFVLQDRTVFLVGDPKQAIYSFRGADIFTYLSAAKDAPTQYSLDTNRRSDAPLVSAVNRLFNRASPFLLSDIQYLPVHAAPSSGQTLSVADDDAPFTVLAGELDGDKPSSKELAAGWSAKASAAEIARLLALAGQGQATLSGPQGERPLNGGDIAVLVSTHRQGDRVREALAALNVPSVSLTQASVFASDEAADLLAVLRAWAEPASESRLRAALVTELCGLDAAGLLAEVEDETRWEARLSANQQDHQRWLEKGFMAAWRQFFAREKLALRLLPLPDGERRLTNLSHLAELLQKESDSRRGMAPLLAWFEAQVASPPGGEEAVLRLESDARLVKIVTIHTSKGLQYPVVFCPFLWDGALERRGTAFWRYREAGQPRLAPDLLADDAVREQAAGETLAEKLRLLYVALTRAQHRQYLCWSRVKDMQTAALSWLLHGRDCAGLADLRELELAAERIRADLAALAGTDLAVRDALAGAAPLPAEAADHAVLAAQTLKRSLYTPWRVTSFTSLAHGAGSRLAERPDHDALPTPAAPDALEKAIDAPPPDSPFAFPRGSRAGTCLHAIFENIDFTTPEATWTPLAAQQLSRHGFDEAWLPSAVALVRQTLQAELDPGVRLADVPPARRLVELEFTLPLGKFAVERLIAVLSAPEHGLAAPLRAAAQRLDFHTVNGYLKGFVDLVFESGGRFYLVDYKSNYLGDQPEDYLPDSLAQSIAQEHYYLQYLLYCVALKRYLASRGLDYAYCFGGVRYLYLRGMGRPGCGVWADQPAAALLTALEAALISYPA